MNEFPDGIGKKLKVYIASPYTKGNREVNVQNSIRAADLLAEKGFVPFVPLLSHYWHKLYNHGVDFWYDIDLEWLKACDVLVRLDGESAGADMEVRFANNLKIPVFHGVNGIIEFYTKENDHEQGTV